MAGRDIVGRLLAELAASMALAKCRRCGCLRDTLAGLAAALPALPGREAALLSDVLAWREQLEPLQYSCLGCAYCYGATATNLFARAFPAAEPLPALACAFELAPQGWPPAPGEYHVLGRGADRPVAVSTLGSPELADRLAALRPPGLCLAGKTETENIGIDKVIKNVVANPAIKYLLLAGRESAGHESGRTLLALAANGVDPNMVVVGAPGRRPVLRNVSAAEVAAFRHQVQVVDMIGDEDAEAIVARVQALTAGSDSGSGSVRTSISKPGAIIDLESLLAAPAPQVRAAEAPAKVELDPAGYFVILPQPERGLVVVEYYAYDNALRGTVEGSEARDLYLRIIANGWVSQLSHAAYLGKELAKAELSLALGFKYVQDGA
jgi:tetrahydromethanopterin S-methyltransferase subunit A